MDNIILLLYILNSTLLLIHEMESAYREEWKLFRLPGGINFFLWIHFPVIPLIIFGGISLSNGDSFGWITNLIIAGIGIFAFCIHTWFNRKGDVSFSGFGSKFLLTLILFVSILQIVISLIF